MRLLFRFLSLLLFSLAGLANAGDLIVSRAVLADPTGGLTIDKVVHQEFQPSGAILSKGYTDVVHWLRLEVNAPKSGEPIELRIRPSFLDEVQLYEPDTRSKIGWKVHVSGDRYAFSQRERAAITLGFIIHPDAPVTTYYLRVKTTSTTLLNVEALTPKEAALKELHLHISKTIYLSIMLWLLLFGISHYLNDRQSLTAWFVFYQFNYILYALSRAGYLALFTPDHLPRLDDQLTSIFTVAVVWLSIGFHRTLFQSFAPSKKWLKLLDILLLTSPLAMLTIGWLNPRMALQLNAMIILSLTWIYLILAFTTTQDSLLSKRGLRAVYLLHSVSLLTSMLPILGVIEAVEWSLYAPLLHGLISGFLMFWILHQRLMRRTQLTQQTNLELVLAHQQLAFEHNQAEERGRFINMLTHELKTPLSILRMVLSTPAQSEMLLHQAHRAINDMNNVIEQCVHFDKLEGAQTKVMFDKILLIPELDELQHKTASPDRIIIESHITPTLDTDVQMLRITLSNLIDNALKYSPLDSTIKITINKIKKATQDGIAISIENLPGTAGWPDKGKIFEKYYRSPAAHHQIGTGLGLYLIKNLSRLIGGEISYTPSDTHIRFTLWLPA